MGAGAAAQAFKAKMQALLSGRAVRTRTLAAAEADEKTEATARLAVAILERIHSQLLEHRGRVLWNKEEWRDLLTKWLIIKVTVLMIMIIIITTIIIIIMIIIIIIIIIIILQSSSTASVPFSFFCFKDKSGRRLVDAFLDLPSRRRYPLYYKVIASPLDLRTIEARLWAGRYLVLNDYLVPMVYFPFLSSLALLAIHSFLISFLLPCPFLFLSICYLQPRRTLA